MEAKTPIQEKYDIGYKVFEQLFKLTDKELKAKLQSIVGEKLKTLSADLLEKCSIKRTILDEKCDNITVYFYDKLSISAFGINYTSEHNTVSESLVDFDKHFVL